MQNDYLKPNKYLIFDAIGLENRVFWNNEIHIGSLMYRMVGVTKYYPGHFYCEAFVPGTKTWLLFNSIPERWFYPGAHSVEETKGLEHRRSVP